MADKKTQRIPVWLSEPLELELRRLADLDGRKLSDYIGRVLRQFVYGHVVKLSDNDCTEQVDE
ncbi:MAG: hypothetical protein KGI71_06280 [Patescibacteria group bacterium]|nr:hypothetical protein [Patescibacteria group bacterium]